MLGVPTSNNFLKGARFSPDGTCLLTSSDDTVLRIFEVPSQVLREVRPRPVPHCAGDGELSQALGGAGCFVQLFTPCHARKTHGCDRFFIGALESAGG